MPRLTKKLPKYRLHRASGQAIVSLNGKTFYLGAHGSEESRAEYDRLIGLWLGNGRQLPGDAPGEPAAGDAAGGGSGRDAGRAGAAGKAPASKAGPAVTGPAPEDITIVEMILRYDRHARTYYQKNGEPTSEFFEMQRAARPMLRMFGNLAARDFDAARLEEVRESYIEAGLSRGVVNQSTGRIKRIFKWAARKKLVPMSVYQDLALVEGLRRGRSRARETDPVRPVQEALVRAIEPHVAGPVWAMVQLQWLTGMRSGEVVIMRGADLDTRGRVWVYTPASHKTEHHGHARKVDLGPRAQELIRPHLTGDPQAFLFAPPSGQGSRGGHAYRRKKKGGRTGRRLGERYTTASYRRAITRGCDLAFPVPAKLGPVEGETLAAWWARLPAKRRAEVKAWRKAHRWHPHQLRHAAATRIRRDHGLDAARAILGHRTLRITEAYAEFDRERVRDVVAKIG